MLKKVGNILLKIAIWSPYYMTEFLVIMVKTFPVSIILGISALLLNPAILVKNNFDVLRVLVEQYNTIFTYGIYFSVLFSIIIILLQPLRYITQYVSNKY